MATTARALPRTVCRRAGSRDGMMAEGLHPSTQEYWMHSKAALLATAAVSPPPARCAHIRPGHTLSCNRVYEVFFLGMHLRAIV